MKHGRLDREPAVGEGLAGGVGRVQHRRGGDPGHRLVLGMRSSAIQRTRGVNGDVRPDNRIGAAVVLEAAVSHGRVGEAEKSAVPCGTQKRKLEEGGGKTTNRLGWERA